MYDPGYRSLTGLRPERSGFRISQGHFFSKRPVVIWDTPSVVFSGYRVLFPAYNVWRVMNTPSSVEVKNEWSYTSIPSLCLHSMDRKHFYGFYFTYFWCIQESMIFCVLSYEGPVISQSPWLPASCKMFCPLEHQLHQIVNFVSQGNVITF